MEDLFFLEFLLDEGEDGSIVVVGELVKGEELLDGGGEVGILVD